MPEKLAGALTTAKSSRLQSKAASITCSYIIQTKQEKRIHQSYKRRVTDSFKLITLTMQIS